MFSGAATGGAFETLRLLLQSPPPSQPTGVEIPILPLLVAVGTLFLLAAIVANAFLKPAAAAVRHRRKPKPKPEVKIQPPPEPPKEPVFKKAPAKIRFEPIPDGYPDVWGVDEAIQMRVRLTEKKLVGKANPDGLTVKVAGEPVDPSFQKGVARFQRTFKEKGEVPVTVEWKAPGEKLPRRTTRNLRIVDYREEIAEVFAKFKDEASRVIRPIPEDATPREVLDLLMDANPNLPEENLSTIVNSFEVAKFSNHPVDRADYERMIAALLELERVEI